MTKALTLIAPDIAPALRQAIAERGARWPQLARLGGRGSIHALPAPRDGLRTWQAALLDVLGVHDHALYPSAAVMHTGDVGETARGFWLHLQPMHFVAGLDRLTAVVLHGASDVARGAGGAGADDRCTPAHCRHATGDDIARGLARAQ